MKKNILGALVIFVVTIAIMLMIDDISAHKRAQQGETMDYIENSENSELATTDDSEQ